jgi:hypothetical protein
MAWAGIVEATSVRIICGFCKVEPQQLAYGNGERELMCLKCGQRAKPETAIEIANGHASAKRPLRNGFHWHLRNKSA